jgi:hypothetical protein
MRCATRATGLPGHVPFHRANSAQHSPGQRLRADRGRGRPDSRRAAGDIILGVRGKDHPLPTYLAAGVPVVLSTDDAGVSRIDIIHEYFRAARDYGLSYRTLKEIARNALVHSFLGKEQKNDELTRFDQSVAEFERGEARTRPTVQNLLALIEAAVTPAR